MNTEGLTPEERRQVDTAIHDAYIADDGTTRPAAEALEEFEHILNDAVQAHNVWPGVLLDRWRREGMRKFIHQRWKELDGRYSFTHKGRSRERTVKRGRQVRDAETGRQVWVQDPLYDFTAADLRRAIAEAKGRISEEQANIATWRALLDLLEVTGCATVRAALEKTGQSLEQYLASAA